MKQRLVWLLSATVLLSIAGCSSTKKTDSTSETTAISADYGDVTLCDYKNLSVEKSIYTVTDEEIETEINSLLSEYAEHNEVARAAKSGDTVKVNFTAKSGDDTILDYTSEEVEIVLGEEEYGEEVDKQLTGALAGDKRSFSVTYDEEYWDADMAGKTVEFEMTVNAVVEEILPECTDTFVSENLGYESYKDMKAQIKSSLEKDNELNSEYQMRENLVQQIIDSSNITSYSDELYEHCEQSVEESYSAYASFYGCEDVQQFYDLVGLTEDTIKQEVEALVNRTIVLNAISEKEGIALSDSDYEEGLARYVSDYNYESTEDLLAEYEEDEIRGWLLEDKILDAIQETATITEVQASESEEDLS